MFSNSSRLRCRLRNAAARFLTRRASRLLRPVTSGGTKSFTLTALARGFFAVEGARLEARLAGTRLALRRAEKFSELVRGELGLPNNLNSDLGRWCT